jgi:hypothetical protein
MTLNKFKNGSGAHLLKPIFYELDNAEKTFAVYTLKDYDHTVDGVTYPSLRRLYVELADPTEYTFALTYLDGWSHWKKLCEANWFKEHLREWREELEVKLRAAALLKIRETAAADKKESFQAQKFIVQGGWKSPEEKEKVGRPSQAKIVEEAEKLFKERSVHDEDFDRLFPANTVN